MIGVETKIGKTLNTRLEALKARLVLRAPLALKAVGDVLLQESQQLVPVDTSALLESSQVRLIGSGFNAVVYVGYGIQGEAYTRWSEKEQKLVTRIPAEYAVFVHEVQASHDLGRQWNFLLEPLYVFHNEMITAFNTVIAGNA
jgi:hypothetical protein